MGYAGKLNLSKEVLVGAIAHYHITGESSG
jgi:hypothetical protein